MKRNASKPDGTVPLMGRITIDKTISQFSCKMTVPPNLWDTKAGRLTGKSSSCNTILKKIAKQCGIDKRITYHQSRHTLSTTITLSQGVLIETVSKMLGHTNIKTTQIYAKITKEKISQDMEILSHKLESLEKQITEML